MSKYRFVFRADGNAMIGAGHIMRCLTIADALRKKYPEAARDSVVFVTADKSSAEPAVRRGYDTVILDTDYTDMEGELEKWVSLDINQAIIIADSYYITEKYVEELGQYGRVCILDDMQSRFYPADMIINYNAYADKMIYKRLYGSLTPCILGTDYVPVREQFTTNDYIVRDRVSNVMITTGGGDVCNIGGQIYSALKDISPNIKYHLISGGFNPNFSRLVRLSEENDNLEIYHNIENMAEVMKRCDIAITAGGSTVYELCALGVPLICFSYASNQEPLVRFMGRIGAAHCGAFNRQAVQVLTCIQKSIEALLPRERRSQLSFAERSLVDGKGAERIADLILGKL